MRQLSLLSLLYLVPLISLVFFPLKRFIIFGSVHSFFGRIEWLFSFLRDGLLAPFLFGYLVYTIADFFIKKEAVFPLYDLLYIILIDLSIWNYFYRRHRVRGFLVLIVTNPLLKPSEFFKLYFASISGLPGHFPAAPERFELPINYLKGSGKTIWAIVPGFIATGIAARLVIRASKWKGGDFCKVAGEKVSPVWGAKLIELAGGDIDVKGLENLKNVSGRSVFVCNHKSFMDFAVVPLVIGLANIDRSEPFRPRYMAARNHFYDNKFLYRVVGMGKAMEEMGTVFVDRRSAKEPARNAVDRASEAILSDGVDIVMFPQGTRAHGNIDLRGERLDAGYYTTGTEERLMRERGHLKKGAAYLAVGAAEALSKRGIPLNIVPIGLKGTGIMAPRKRLRIQKGIALKVIFGRPYTLTAENLGSLENSVENIFVKIDEMLKEILSINAELKKRLAVDVRRIMQEGGMEKFFEAMSAWRADQDLLFSVVDCIYSSPVKKRGPFLRRLHQLLVQADTPMEEILAFKKIVVHEMIKGR